MRECTGRKRAAARNKLTAGYKPSLIAGLQSYPDWTAIFPFEKIRGGFESALMGGIPFPIFARSNQQS
jgi:hypothetical protein